MNVTAPTGISPRFLALLEAEDLERKRVARSGLRLGTALARFWRDGPITSSGSIAIRR